MSQILLLAFAPPLLALPARADEAIAPETVAAVKAATVFVRVEGDGWSGSGSGFVVGVAGDALLAATNHHVVAAPGRVRGAKPPAVTVVFDSGTKAERSYPAAVVGSDAERDLAVLRIAGVKAPPKPRPAADTPKLVETVPVYPFGFPFGQALATDKGFPAVTVGKASVSSLRNGPDGELSVIQIDGNLNPGNSGGPVIDAKGRLVGVAVATVKDSQGIGFVVPAGELGQMMRGCVGRVRVLPKKGSARIEAQIIDPAGTVRGASAYYLVLPPKAKRPAAAALAEHPDAKTVTLKIEAGVGVADIPLAAADGELLLQVAVEPAGRAAVADRVRAYPLGVPADLTGPPPAGWKVYEPRDKSFLMWVPEKPVRQSDSERASTVGGQRLRVSTVIGQVAGGFVYEGQTITLPPTFLRTVRGEMHELFRDAIAAELKGKVTDAREVTAGRLTGFEYRIEGGGLTARARVYVSGARVFVVQVVGAAEAVASPDAERMLNAYRAAEPVSPAPPVLDAPGAAAKVPTIFGGGAAAVFKDVPTGGLLVGVEVVVGKAGDRDAIRSVMPLYRVGTTDSFGAQFGTATDDPVSVKAKAGYAVGGLVAKAGDHCDGFGLLFMRVANGRLDPTDTYPSEWIGWNGPAQAGRVLSDGTPVTGVAGRATDKDVTGFGLVFAGQEAFDPKAVPVGPAPTVPAPAKEPTIFGRAFDPVFKEVAPAGGLLVGFEVGTAQAFGHQMTRSVRPIHRTAEKESFGEQRGTRLANVVTLKAKAGYAVGAISVMHGLGFDGLSVTFMKVADGKLDPADSYESQYVGSGQKKPLTKLGGDGAPVVGLVGKSNATDLTGLGLLFKEQEGYRPK